MIPLARPALEHALEGRLDAATQMIAGPDLAKSARTRWRAERTIKNELRAVLASAAHRASFCMYCHESRGTDIDHFEPIHHNPLRAFAWTNHLLACGYCNQQAKREQFPTDPGTGQPLLLDPFTDDAANHMTLAPSGAFVSFDSSGDAVIAVLRLNERRELIRARLCSWSTVVRIFSEAAQVGHLTDRDKEDLQFLPVVDAYHYFAHDCAAGALKDKGVSEQVEDFARSVITDLQAAFPMCGLERAAPDTRPRGFQAGS